MNDDLAMYTCKNCGPKAACLFAPSQLKLKTAHCLKCMAAIRKLYIVPNPVPASASGYKFDRNYGRQNNER